MSFEVITSYIPLYVEAFFLTLRIGWAGITLAVVLGIMTAFLRHFRVPVLRQIAGVYVELFRNTPLLCQLFFLYFGLPKAGISIPAETCGILGLGLLGGSYMAEVFRSGLDSIPVTQEEGALALGLSRRQLFTYVVFPEALTLSVPGIVGNMIFLLKETSVFSAISLMDLMFTAKDLIGLYYNTTEALFLLVIFYILMLLPVSILGSFLEKRVKIRTYGA